MHRSGVTEPSMNRRNTWRGTLTKPSYSPTETPNSTASRSEFQRASSGNVKNMSSFDDDANKNRHVRILFPVGMQCWRRAKVLNALTDVDARAIGFDIIFSYSANRFPGFEGQYG